MIVALATALVVAQAPATVGDTVWVESTIPLPGRMIVRPQPWDLGDVGLVLGPPLVELAVDSATIRYPLVLWYPGVHRLRVPGAIVVSPEGASDTLPEREVVLSIASVLPADASRDSLDPKPAAGLIPQAARSPLAVIVLELAVGIVAVMVAVVWRRRDRRRRVQVSTPPVAALPDLPRTLAAWAAAGELRAAVDGWAHRIEAAHPDPAGRPPAVAAWLARAERAGFTDRGAAAELEELLESAPAWPDTGAGET